jgi:hypothetical protein
LLLLLKLELLLLVEVVLLVVVRVLVCLRVDKRIRMGVGRVEGRKDRMPLL